MTDTIAVWEPTLKTVLEGVTGVKKAWGHDELPESVDQFPSIMIIPGAAEYEYSVGGPNHIYWSTRIILWFSRQMLPKANEKAYETRHGVMEKLAANITLSGTINSILPAPGIPWTEPGALPYTKNAVYFGSIGTFQIKQGLSGDSDWVPAA